MNMDMCSDEDEEYVIRVVNIVTINGQEKYRHEIEIPCNLSNEEITINNGDVFDD